MRQPTLFEFVKDAPAVEKIGESTLQEIKEKAVTYGTRPLSNRELLALLIPERQAQRQVLEFVDSYQHGSLARLSGRSVQELAVHQIGQETALTIMAAVELGIRIGKEQLKNKTVDFSSPQAIAEYVMEDMRHQTQEQFRVAYITTKNELIAVRTLSVGTINASLAKARDVFKWALFYNAASVILLHNHPSGDPEPSHEDIAVTQHIARAGENMEIPVLDHIIIGDGKFVSLCERGFV